MLDLKLRRKFRGKLLKGTAIELAHDSKTGATQLGPKSFLDGTYPTHGLIKAVEAIGPHQGRPVVVIVERGSGKFLMAARTAVPRAGAAFRAHSAGRGGRVPEASVAAGWRPARRAVPRANHVSGSG
jgi:hypothetical protein